MRKLELEQHIKECKERLVNGYNENKFSLYTQIAIDYRHLKMYQEALTYTQHAMHEADTKKDFILCYWNFGIIYKHLGNKTKSLRFYNRCLDFYSRKEDARRTGDTLKNISRVTLNPKTAMDAIEIFKKGLGVEPEITQEVLDDALDNLYDIYVMQGKYLNAFEAIKNIQNDELRQRLTEQLICLQKAN